MVAPAGPVSWSTALYAAIEAGIRRDVLAVCVAHRGAHVWILDHVDGWTGEAIGWCQALPPARSRWERYLTSRDPSPEPSPPIRVEIDEERLASAIVAASRATRDERRAERRVETAVVAGRAVRRDAPPPGPDEPRDDPPSRTIPTVTVWSPGMDDGASE